MNGMSNRRIVSSGMVAGPRACRACAELEGVFLRNHWVGLVAWYCDNWVDAALSKRYDGGRSVRKRFWRVLRNKDPAGGSLWFAVLARHFDGHSFVAFPWRCRSRPGLSIGGGTGGLYLSALFCPFLRWCLYYLCGRHGRVSGWCSGAIALLGVVQAGDVAGYGLLPGGCGHRVVLCRFNCLRRRWRRC